MALPTSPRQQRLRELQRKLTALAAETAQIENEIAALKSDAVLKLEAPRATQAPPRTPAEKGALLLDLFGTRRSVYPKRWENEKTGRSYGDYLAWQVETGPAGKSKAYVNLSQGWALGGKEYKSALVKEHQLAADTRAWESVGAQEIREESWSEALARRDSVEPWFSSLPVCQIA